MPSGAAASASRAVGPRAARPVAALRPSVGRERPLCAVRRRCPGVKAGEKRGEIRGKIGKKKKKILTARPETLRRWAARPGAAGCVGPPPSALSRHRGCAGRRGGRRGIRLQPPRPRSVRMAMRGAELRVRAPSGGSLWCGAALWRLSVFFFFSFFIFSFFPGAENAPRKGKMR